MFTLKKDPNKDFIVLNLTDVQMKDINWTEDNFRNEVIRHTVATLIERVKPDLITVSGDIAYAGQYTSYEKFADLLESFNIPWAPVWGNHDNQAGPEPVEKVEEIYLKKTHCLYEKGDPAMGKGNYLITIEENGHPVHGIIMLDSHNRNEIFNEEGVRINKYDKIWKSQIDWYSDICNDLKQQGCCDTTMIFHIPIYAFNQAFSAAFLKGILPREVNPKESYNPVFWNEGYKDSFGIKHKEINTYYQDDGVLDCIIKNGSTKLVLVGHDHLNNWSIKYKGVRLTYSLKTGAGHSWKPFLSGGTVLRIGSEGLKEVYHEYVDGTPFMPKA